MMKHRSVTKSVHHVLYIYIKCVLESSLIIHTGAKPCCVQNFITSWSSYDNMNLSTGVRFSEKITKVGQIEQLIGQIGDMFFLI